MVGRESAILQPCKIEKGKLEKMEIGLEWGGVIWNVKCRNEVGRMFRHQNFQQSERTLATESQ